MGFNFWKPERGTFEGYLRTNRDDWFSAVRAIVGSLNGATWIMDIGSGDGHSTRQVLARLQSRYICDLLEPNKNALCHSLGVLRECSIGNAYDCTLYQYLQHPGNFDATYSIHTNYYWGRVDDKKQSKRQYDNCLEKLVTLAPKNLILTAPSTSDYYSVVQVNPFPEWVYSEYAIDFYRARGCNVNIIDCNMRLYVNDIYDDKGAAKELWRFFNDTEANPSQEQLNWFTRKTADINRKGQINFKDQLLVITT